MTHVVGEPCIACKFTDCVSVCPNRLGSDSKTLTRAPSTSTVHMGQGRLETPATCGPDLAPLSGTVRMTKSRDAKRWRYWRVE